MKFHKGFQNHNLNLMLSSSIWCLRWCDVVGMNESVKKGEGLGDKEVRALKFE